MPPAGSWPRGFLTTPSLKIKAEAWTMVWRWEAVSFLWKSILACHLADWICKCKRPHASCDFWVKSFMFHVQQPMWLLGQCVDTWWLFAKCACNWLCVCMDHQGQNKTDKPSLHLATLARGLTNSQHLKVAAGSIRNSQKILNTSSCLF